MNQTIRQRLVLVQAHKRQLERVARKEEIKVQWDWYAFEFVEKWVWVVLAALFIWWLV